ncbi:hypothetical protein JXB31_04875, partial [Candidatus Woesearchaeota archaeon]|nr:hypothetical protein [Candidatus Woesearchaeota archaeon]
MLFAAFIILVIPANAAITTINAVVTPSTAYTTSSLDCGFIVTGNMTSYLVNVTWINGSSAHNADDQIDIITLNNTLTNTGTTGDLEAADIKKGETWSCHVTGTDGLGNTLSATSAPVAILNSEPAFTSTAKTTARTGSAYTYTVTASDADADALTYSLLTFPVNMSITAGGVISWTPSESQAGSHNVVVQVSDGSATATQEFTISVSKLKLGINSLKADCSPEDCDDNLDEATGGSIDNVVPGSTLELEIRVENLWDDDEDDHDIENIEVEAVLEEMGDEDDQEVDADFDDLEPGDKSDRITLEFDIPWEADEDTYELELTITAEDEDGTDYEIELTIDVEVEKESHKLWIKRSEATPQMISCNRNVDIITEVKNVGSKDEDGVELVLENSDLGISISEFFDLEAGEYDDDDTERKKIYSFKIADSVKAGSYNIEMKAYYEDEDEWERAMIPLIVQSCAENDNGDTDDNEDNGDDDDDEEDVQVIVDNTLTGDGQGTQSTG